jgi:hypothetical protein
VSRNHNRVRSVIQCCGSAGTEWTKGRGVQHNPRMRRSRHDIFAKSRLPRYVVLWDLQWRVIEVRRLEPASDLYGAPANAAERLKRDGWQIEGTVDHGFPFVNRKKERRLLMLTERDPAESSRQTFSPFR